MLKIYPFTCYLVGEDNLIIQCAETLLTKSHFILGIVSKLSAVKEWAHKNQIPYFDSLKPAKVFMDESNFDYLFSITNSYSVSGDLLRYPQKLAINYHDSLLPHYAGMHVTSWAILNNEKVHGITWHVMAEKINECDILKQAEIKIEPQDTASSLILKCRQQAVITFGELADELAAKSHQRVQQDMSQRRFYSFNKKPVGNGWINWNSPAEEIDRLYRALSFGKYINRLSLPKFTLGNKVFVIDKLQVLNEYSQATPGTVVDISTDHCCISTTTQTICLLQVSNLRGQLYTFEELIGFYGFEAGLRLPIPDEFLTKKLKKLSAMYCKYEAFWVQELNRFKPATLPFLPLTLLADNRNTTKFNQLWTFDFPETLYHRLMFNFSSKTSMPYILLTTWLIYLYRLGNQDNLGILVNRYPLTDQLAPFISSLAPFFIGIHSGMNFEQVLKIVLRQYAQIEKHYTYMRDIKRRYPGLSEHAGISPIAMLVLDNPEIEIEFAKCKINSAVLVVFSSDGKKTSLFVNSELVKTENHLLVTLNNARSHFYTLLNAILENKSQTIMKLPLLTLEERKQILMDWNQTNSHYPKEKTIPELFEEQVKKTPQSVAIFCEDQLLTYSDLSRKSDILARRLQAEGIKPGDFVAIHLERGSLMIVAILGILKIGASYIPIDTAYPIKHVEFILNDSLCSLVIADEKYKEKLQDCVLNDGLACQISVANEEWLTEKNIEQPDHFLKGSPESIAYIIYTSGTTGNPKGVMVAHKSVVNLSMDIIKKLRITEDSKVLQFASISFDASVWEIFSTFLAGGTLYIPHKGKILAGRSLMQYLNKHEINVVTLTPSVLNTLPCSQIPSLKTLVTAGEICPVELAEKWKDGCLLINAYGPTETTVCATMNVISVQKNVSTSIGKPIANTSVYVMDDHLNSVPIGVIGELYVCGEGLSLGYLNLPELTEQKFIVYPIDAEKGIYQKFYKTGDLVRWLPDGNLEYIGRKDNQVKIRGFRIELEAVEAHLRQHENIKECVVTAHYYKNLGKCLIAYVVSKDHEILNNAELKDFLRQRVPHYMIPSFIIPLKTLSLNNNSKINYQALPLPNFRQKSLCVD